jgi:Ca-activated chloride channel homolog
MKFVNIVALACLLQRPPEPFRVQVDAVRVDALVTDGSRAVRGLSAADFELRDNGVLQRIETAISDEAAINVMLVLDTSSSVEGTPLEHLRDAASATIAALRPADRVALVGFSDDVQVLVPWSTPSAELTAAMVETRGSGSTSLYDAAYSALIARTGDRAARPLIIIFTDGADTSSWLPGQSVVDLARRTDVVVYGVSTGDPRDETVAPFRLQLRSGYRAVLPSLGPPAYFDDFLTVLAHETGGRVFRPETPAKLRETFMSVLDEFRSRYLLTYTPRGVNTQGWHDVDVRLKGRKGTVRARPGYSR